MQTTSMSTTSMSTAAMSTTSMSAPAIANGSLGRRLHVRPWLVRPRLVRPRLVRLGQDFLPLVVQLLVVLLLPGLPLHADVPAQDGFVSISYADGLINSSVSSIVQDDAGFLWFGTQSGVQRYDGYGMRLYTAEPFNRNSLSNQLVQTIYLGPDSILWAGTYGGLNRLDIKTGNIQAFDHQAEDHSTLSNNVVTAITHDSSGVLWVATLNGLNRLDSEEDARFTRFLPDEEDPQALPHQTVRAVFRDSRGLLWTGTHGGLSRVDTDAHGEVRFLTWGAEGPEDRSLPSPYVMTIAEDARGHLWVGTWDGGVSRFDPVTETFRHYKPDDTRLYTVMVARNGLVYAGTWGGGLYVINPETGEITPYRHDPERTGTLAHDVVYSLYEDRSGLIWIGTNGNGINYSDSGWDSFRYSHPELPREERIDSGKVQVLWRDPLSNDLYVGLQHNGLNVVDGATGIVTRYRHDPADSRSLSSNTINGILPADDGTLLVSTHAGINRFDPKTGYFSRLTDPEIPDPIVYRMIRDVEGRLWVGTYNSGVFRYDPDGTLHNFSNDAGDERSLSDNLVYDIFQDRYGVVWIATNAGLNRYSKDRDDFDRFIYDPDDRNGISGLSVGNLYEDSRGTLWVGTRSSGLNRFDRETETFQHFTIREGLTSNTVVSVSEGEAGSLYVATPNGLNLLLTDEDRVVSIDERDGLAVREFSTGFFREPSGALLLGAFSRVVRVSPPRAVEVGISPRTVITGASVLNASLDVVPEYTPLVELDLTHTQNFLEFTFAVLSFSLPERNTYRYRLTGFDSGWIDSGTRNTATYTNIPPGDYEFQVIGSNARGLASGNPARVIVRIRPPYWRTAWFVSALVLLIMGLAATGFLLRVRSLHRINRRLEDTVAERTARLSEANEVKDRFFSIIAHDLRGPVFGMESLTRQVVTEYKTYSPELVGEVFTTIHGTASTLLRMLENLLEWARVQSGRMEYTPGPVPIAALLNEIVQANQSAAGTKEITLHVQCDAALRATADLNMTRVILQNLVSNAIKFTPSGGEVTLLARVASGGAARDSAASASAASVSKMIELVVRDTGVGIPSEKIEDLFHVERRFRTTGTAGERGSGFGLGLCHDLAKRQGGSLTLSSQVGQGTEVTLTLLGGG